MAIILKKNFWVFNLLVIALCAGLLGRAAAGALTSALLAGTGPMPGSDLRRPPPAGVPGEGLSHSKDPTAILERNIFCSTCAPVRQSADPAAPVDNSPQRSTLPLQLLATLLRLDDRLSSMAVIREVGDRKSVRIYSRGNALLQNGTQVALVAQVVDRRVYLVVGKRVEYLDQDGAPPPPPPAQAQGPMAVAAAEPSPGEGGGLRREIDKGVRCSSGNCEVDKSLVDKLLANTAALATDVRVFPFIKDGKPSGFRVAAIQPGSIFAKLGMQNADVIKSINDLDMSSPDKALEAYTKLRSASHLSLKLERGGTNVTFDYQIRG